MDNFGKNNWPLPPRCIMSISYSSSHTSAHDRTESVLNYPVPIDGVAEPVTLFIHRETRAFNVSASQSPILPLGNNNYYC